MSALNVVNKCPNSSLEIILIGLTNIHELYDASFLYILRLTTPTRFISTLCHTASRDIKTISLRHVYGHRCASGVAL